MLVSLILYSGNPSFQNKHRVEGYTLFWVVTRITSSTFTNLSTFHSCCSLHLHRACREGKCPQNSTFNFLLPPSKVQKVSCKTCTLKPLFHSASSLLFIFLHWVSDLSWVTGKHVDSLRKSAKVTTYTFVLENHSVSLFMAAKLGLTQRSAFFKALPVSLLVPNRLKPHPNVTQSPPRQTQEAHGQFCGLKPNLTGPLPS